MLPWLTPFAGGPSPSVLPWLTTAACVAGLMVLCGLASGPLLTSQLIACAWLVAALISAAIALMQYLGLGEALAPWVNATRPGEAFGNLRQRNHLATLMSIGLLALLWKGGLRTTGWQTGVMVALLAFGNAASGSRTGAVQWVLIVMLAALWSVGGGRRRLYMALIALIAYVLATLILPWLFLAVTGQTVGDVLGRFSEAAGCASRTVLWSNVLDLIALKPWSGWGWGKLDYAHYMTLYPGERFCDILDNAHNLPLHLAVELGIPAAVLTCGLLIGLTWHAKPKHEIASSRQMAWGVLAVIGLHSLLEYPLWYGPFQLAVGLCMLLLWKQPTDGLTLGRLWPFASMTVVPAVAIALVAYALFDYYRVSQIYLPLHARNAAYIDDTLGKSRQTRLFGNLVLFAELSTQPLTSGNAEKVYAMSSRLLHFSPEPRVIEKLIESAAMLGRDEEAMMHRVRYKAAFPEDYEKWANTMTSKLAQVR